MAEKMKTIERKKPKFRRQDSHKMIKLGNQTTKKKQVWRRARGRHSKVRLGRRGHSRRPKIGWGAEKTTEDFVRIETLKDLEGIKIKKILIAGVGAKKKKEIIKKATEMKLEVLNRYKKLDDFTEGKKDETETKPVEKKDAAS
jgi:ribosomal protein L32E